MTVHVEGTGHVTLPVEAQTHCLHLVVSMYPCGFVTVNLQMIVFVVNVTLTAQTCDWACAKLVANRNG